MLCKMSLLQLFFVFVVSASFVSADSVNVTLLYRPFCPHSKDFILENFFPTYNTLGDDVLNIEIVLTSRSTYVNGKLVPTCSSEDECTVETYSSCILAKNYTQSQKMKYIKCLASYRNKVMESNLKKCVEKADIAWTDVEKCYKNGDGLEALIEFNRIQRSYNEKITHVPFLVFNGKVDYDVDEEARLDFLETVCGYLQEKPKACL